MILPKCSWRGASLLAAVGRRRKKLCWGGGWAPGLNAWTAAMTGCRQDWAARDCWLRINIVKEAAFSDDGRSEEHTSELQSQSNLVCRLLLEKKKKTNWLV